MEPSGLFPLQHTVQAVEKSHVYFLTIKLVFISEEMVLLIYLYIFVVVVAASATLLYLLARCVCMCESDMESCF